MTEFKNYLYKNNNNLFPTLINTKELILTKYECKLTNFFKTKIKNLENNNFINLNHSKKETLILKNNSNNLNKIFKDINKTSAQSNRKIFSSHKVYRSRNIIKNDLKQTSIQSRTCTKNLQNSQFKINLKNVNFEGNW